MAEDNPSATPQQEPALIFISTDWLPARKQWAPEWSCPKTGEKGSGMYFPDDGSSFSLEATDGKSEIVAIKGDKNAPPDPNKVTLMLRIYGGNPAFQQAPKRAYINLNASFIGGRYMTIEDYERLCTQHSVPMHTPATLLDNYHSSRV